MTKEKRIAELEKQVKDLEWQLQEVVKDNDDYQAENKRLEQQIEKMKCCYNCSKWNDGECENIKDGYFFHCADFGCDKWEIKENGN